jgi:hypothetical protein
MDGFISERRALVNRYIFFGVCELEIEQEDDYDYETEAIDMEAVNAVDGAFGFDNNIAGASGIGLDLICGYNIADASSIGSDLISASSGGNDIVGAYDIVGGTNISVSGSDILTDNIDNTGGDTDINAINAALKIPSQDPNEWVAIYPNVPHHSSSIVPITYALRSEMKSNNFSSPPRTRREKKINDVGSDSESNYSSPGKPVFVVNRVKKAAKKNPIAFGKL